MGTAKHAPGPGRSVTKVCGMLATGVFPGRRLKAAAGRPIPPAPFLPAPTMSNTALYLLGFLVLTAGLAMGAHLAGVPTAWIGVGGVVLLGLGILLAVTKTRDRETPPGSW